MRDYPPLDPRTKEEILEELVKRAGEQGGGLRAAKGGLLYALLALYADMLGDTAARLNRVSEKHRLAFLNLQQTPRLPACPGQGIVVFTPVEGYDRAVRVPRGSLAAARAGESPLLYRTKWDFDAIPAKLWDVVWTDGETDTVEPAYTQTAHDPGQEAWKPFFLWRTGPPRRGRHTVDFTFETVFSGVGGSHTVLLDAVLSLAGEPLDSAILADPARFLWSLHALPGGEDDAPLSVSVDAEGTAAGGVRLAYRGFPCEKTAALLRMELLDPELTGLFVERFCILSGQRGIPPEAVAAGDRELDAEDFYPFQSPMRALEECFIFCGDALLRPGGEVTAEFDLSLEETLEKLPEEPREIEYKWVMKRPREKPEPEIFEAFPQWVRWEYWNGAAYCALSLPGDGAADFTRAADGLKLTFDCPADIASGSAGERTGYFLRLSSGLCDGLYRLPRRAHTPRVRNLRFSYRYRRPVFPTRVTCENFGEGRELSTEGGFAPFCRPPGGQRLFLGLDALPRDAQIRIFLDLENRLEERQTFLTAWLWGDVPQELAMDDGTYGLTRGGILSLVSPKKPEPFRLFGRSRYWLCLCVGERQSPRPVSGIYLNAQRAENRIRHKQYYSFSALGPERTVRLAGGNIIKAWVYVRARDHAGWEEWREHTLEDGEFGEGFYRLDFQSGTLAFPPELAVRAAGLSGEDLVGVVYDACDGGLGNAETGAVCRMQEEIPFIAGVSNPLPMRGGADSEPDDRLAARAEHRLCHGERAVSPRDFELIARDRYPCVAQARCVAGRPVRLAILLGEEDGRMSFPQIRAELLKEFARHGCAAAAGTTVEILEAMRVPMTICVRFASRRHVLSPVVERFKAELAEFMSPVSGGLRGDGWAMGTLPSYAQTEAFIASRLPELTLERLVITAQGGGLSGGWQELTPGPFHLPGEVRTEVEVVSC